MTSSIGACYPAPAENRYGRIGKPGLFPETGILSPLAVGPTAGRSDEVVTLPVGRAHWIFGLLVSFGFVSVRSSNLNG